MIPHRSGYCNRSFSWAIILHYLLRSNSRFILATGLRVYIVSRKILGVDIEMIFYQATGISVALQLENMMLDRFLEESVCHITTL